MNKKVKIFVFVFLDVLITIASIVSALAIVELKVADTFIKSWSVGQ